MVRFPISAAGDSTGAARVSVGTYATLKTAGHLTSVDFRNGNPRLVIPRRTPHHQERIWLNALQMLKHARKLTQVRMAKALGIGQDGVSKIEKRADLMIFVAEFPDREPVVLSGIAEEEPEQKPVGRKHTHARYIRKFKSPDFSRPFPESNGGRAAGL
jgi:hypothetical protein